MHMLTEQAAEKALYPSTTLRTNGNRFGILPQFPFVLRLSKHGNLFSAACQNEPISSKPSTPQGLWQLF